MNADLRDSLAQVQELLGRSAPAERIVRAGRHEDQFFVEDDTLYLTRHGDADLIAAAINFLRTHGPALLAMMEDHSPDAGKMGEDAARYRWLASHAERIDYTVPYDDLVQKWESVVDDIGHDHTLDAAIDAARAGERG